MRGKSLHVLVTVVVVCAIGAIAATANAALPEFLGTFPNAFTIASGEETLQSLGGAAVWKCSKDTGSGVVTSSKGGTFTVLWEGCTSLGLSCTGLLAGERAGNVKIEGTFTLGFQLGSLVPVAAFTLGKEVHWECAGVLFSNKGCFMGTITPLTAGTSGAGLFKQTAKGDQEMTDYMSDAGSTVACAMLSESNGGAFESSSLIGHWTLTYSKMIQLDD